ncbi:MAG: Tfp pilus assembly protein FimT/FimU [Alphaproteobacteria bacterium]
MPVKWNTLFLKNKLKHDMDLQGQGTDRRDILTVSRERGRSMVEIIGVLAVIGVLSIGGVAGYSYAMDKHRANKTLNEIDLRLVDLITKMGRDLPLDLDDWDQISEMGYQFEAPIRQDGMIRLGISRVPERVCTMMVEALEKQYDLDINGVRIDESATCGLEDSNTIIVYIEETWARITCSPVCPEGEICVNGVCVENEEQPVTILGTTCETDDDCSACRACNLSARLCSGNLADGSACVIGTSAGTCKEGECQTNRCTSNDDCDANLYCADTNESARTPHLDKCQSPDFVSKRIVLSDGTVERWFVSNNWMSYWNAQKACDKMQLVQVGGNDLFSNWTGDPGDFKLSDRGEKIQEAFGGGGYWVVETYEKDYAFFANLKDGRVVNGETIYYLGPYLKNKNSNTLALCREK